MTALDTPTLHAYLDQIAPHELDGVIVDVGGGDGRNALPWLERGYRRVVVIDAAGDALLRLRERMASRSPEWLARVLLVESDARELPLLDGCAQAVLAIESLCYLNDDYARGLCECARILCGSGRFLLAERDREGALVMQLLYYGIESMLRSHRAGSVWDGRSGTIKNRAFTEAELVEILTASGLSVTSIQGTSLIAMVLGWMNGNDLLVDPDRDVVPIHQLLKELGQDGRMRRSHVLVAEHPAKSIARASAT